MREDEVLAARLTDNARVVLVVVNVVTDRLPNVAEDLRGASVVNAREEFVLDARGRDQLGVTGHEVDDTVGQTGLFEHLHQVVGRVDGVLRWLPHDDVAHDGG